MDYNNIQEVNVNYVKEYPMIFLHNNNKEVMKKKKYDPPCDILLQQYYINCNLYDK